MRIAVLVKQVPKFEAMELGADGRLVRDGLELEMNPYCRRAVAKGVELARATDGTCTVLTLGPPAAEDSLREAVAWGADRGALVTDPAFAGSDTLATARALAAALSAVASELGGPFDLVLAGRNSVDADTGQVGPAIADLLDLPFVTGVRDLEVGEGHLRVRCEEDDGYSDRVVQLPAVVSTAERLCDPAKVDPAGRAAVAADRIAVMTADDLGVGPWGQDGSGTYVGEVRVLDVDRAGAVLSGPISEQVDEAVRLLVARGALDRSPMSDASDSMAPAQPRVGPLLAAVLQPGRDAVARELLGGAARLAPDAGGHAVAVITETRDPNELGAWGADAVVRIDGASVEEDVAAAIAGWARDVQPWAVVLPSTTWGREIGARVSAAIGAGLTGDAIDLEVTTVATTGEPQLLAWKPAFGGRLVAAIYCSTPVQMATVRAGMLAAPAPRRVAAGSVPVSTVSIKPKGRVTISESTRDDDVGTLATASTIVCVGAGVGPDEYELLTPLVDALDAELAATRKVTDKGWQPRARQIGITGRSVAPRLYVGLGLSGKFNHMVGVRAAATVLAVNKDEDALVWEHADIGIVGDWHDVVPLLAEAIARVR